MTKVCSRCKREKGIDHFYKNCRAKDGLQYHCRECHREYAVADRDRRTEYKSKYYQENKVRILEDCKNYRQANATKIAQYQKEYYQTNKEKIGEYHREHYRANKEAISTYHYEYKRKRLQIDVGYRLAKNLRKRIWDAVKGNSKSAPTMELVGCTTEELRLHLEKQFREGMTWDNYGYEGWHVDHIIPIAMFDLTDPQQQRECFNYTNLQPLWASENMSKYYRVSNSPAQLKEVL